MPLASVIIAEPKWVTFQTRALSITGGTSEASQCRLMELAPILCVGFIVRLKSQSGLKQ